MGRQATVSVVIADSATISASGKCCSAGRPLLLRALRCRAIAPDGITYSAAIGACDKSQPH